MREPAALSSWKTARGTLSLELPLVMGVLNVTPDSFSDGGRFATTELALRRAEEMLEQGADLLDIGGESTRPGATPVDADEEISRVLPVIRGIIAGRPNAILSIDTVKASVAHAALAEGAAIVNDVSALRLDAGMADAVARHQAGVVLMHSRGAVHEMASYAQAEYGIDVVQDVIHELRAGIQRARQAGVGANQIVLDPGVGFSKRTEHSVAMIARLNEIAALGHAVLLGPSRKRFVGELAGGLPVEQRLEGTIAACVAGLFKGARIFRVHDVQPVRRALLVAEAIRRAA